MERTIGEKHAKPRMNKGPKRNRSEKDRPKNAGELIVAIDNNRLDGRTGPAKRLTALRAAINRAPVESCLGILKDALALDLTIAQTISAEVARPGFQVLVDGKLNQTLKIWQELKRGLLYEAQLLLQVEAKAGLEPTAQGENRPAPVDISTLILESAADDD